MILFDVQWNNKQYCVYLIKMLTVLGIYCYTEALEYLYFDKQELTVLSTVILKHSMFLSEKSKFNDEQPHDV